MSGWNLNYEILTIIVKHKDVHIMKFFNNNHKTSTIMSTFHSKLSVNSRWKSLMLSLYRRIETIPNVQKVHNKSFCIPERLDPHLPFSFLFLIASLSKEDLTEAEGSMACRTLNRFQAVPTAWSAVANTSSVACPARSPNL